MDLEVIKKGNHRGRICVSSPGVEPAVLIENPQGELKATELLNNKLRSHVLSLKSHYCQGTPNSPSSEIQEFRKHTFEGAILL